MTSTANPSKKVSVTNGKRERWIDGERDCIDGDRTTLLSPLQGRESVIEGGRKNSGTKGRETKKKREKKRRKQEVKEAESNIDQKVRGSRRLTEIRLDREMRE